MQIAPFTKHCFENQVGTNFFIGTKNNVHEGEILAVGNELLTLEYFNGVKDELREMDIPLNQILWAREDV